MAVDNACRNLQLVGDLVESGRGRRLVAGLKVGDGIIDAPCRCGTARPPRKGRQAWGAWCRRAGSISSSAQATGSYVSAMMPRIAAYVVMVTAESISPLSAAHLNAVRRLASSASEPCHPHPAVGELSHRTVICLHTRRSSAHVDSGLHRQPLSRACLRRDGGSSPASSSGCAQERSATSSDFAHQGV